MVTVCEVISKGIASRNRLKIRKEEEGDLAIENKPANNKCNGGFLPLGKRV